MDYLEAVQLAAFDLVSKVRRGEPTNDPSYLYDRIFRWYSKTFSTPLHLVYELPEHDILQAYWREHFESLDDEKLEEARLELIKTEEDREKDKLIKDYEELEFYEDSKLLGEEVEQAPVEKLITEADKFKSALNKMRAGLGKETDMMGPPVKTNLPPNITMNFVDYIDEDADSLGLLDNPKYNKK